VESGLFQLHVHYSWLSDRRIIGLASGHRVRQVCPNIGLIEQRYSTVLHRSVREIFIIQKTRSLCPYLPEETQQRVPAIIRSQRWDFANSITTLVSRVIFWDEYCVLRCEHQLGSASGYGLEGTAKPYRHTCCGQHGNSFFHVLNQVISWQKADLH
jgi:hypothetical protein